MLRPHGARVALANTFDQAQGWLQRNGPQALMTEAGSTFEARAANARDGRNVIRFFQNGKEYGRAYECCWGGYYNCNQTRIGLYCKALDYRISSEHWGSPNPAPLHPSRAFTAGKIRSNISFM